MGAPGELMASAAPQAGDLSPHDVLQRIGMLTRNLHEALRELGYATDVQEAVGALPDARARLNYVARLTGEAAERVLSAAERGKNELEGARAASLHARGFWVGAVSIMEDASQTADPGWETCKALYEVDRRLERIDHELTDIILAQTFHDLTGQVIQKITRVAQSLEEQLVRLLIDATPAAKRPEEAGALAGPVIDARTAKSVCTDQAQVDDLLASMGF